MRAVGERIGKVFAAKGAKIFVADIRALRRERPHSAHDVYARPAPEPPGTGDGPATVAPE